jgi:hypothetical protein
MELYLGQVHFKARFVSGDIRGYLFKNLIVLESYIFLFMYGVISRPGSLQGHIHFRG